MEPPFLGMGIISRFMALVKWNLTFQLSPVVIKAYNIQKVGPVEKDMLKNGVKYFEIPIFGAPFSTYSYQPQIYGYISMEINMPMAPCCDMCLNQLLVWPVVTDILKNGVKNLKMAISGVPFTTYGY